MIPLIRVKLKLRVARSYKLGVRVGGTCGDGGGSSAGGRRGAVVVVVVVAAAGGLFLELGQFYFSIFPPCLLSFLFFFSVQRKLCLFSPSSLSFTKGIWSEVLQQADRVKLSEERR